MSKHIVDRRASDNPYLHRDFHISSDLSLSYVEEHFGKQGVKEFIQQYADTYYKPLAERTAEHGLGALEEYFQEIYEAEEASEALETSRNDGLLQVAVSWCPGVRHMKQKGHAPSAGQAEAVRTLYGALAELAGLDFSCSRYDAETGAAEFMFRERKEPLL